MGIDILLQEGVGMFLYTTMGMGWEWEYGHGNGIESLSAHLVFPTFRNTRFIKQQFIITAN